MTTPSSPLEASFAFQRELLEAGRRSVQQSLDFQRQAGGAVLQAIETQNDVNRQAIEQSESVIVSSIQASDRVAPTGATIPAQFEEAIEAFFVSALDNHEAISTSVEEATRESVEQAERATEEVGDAVDEQFDLVLDAQQTFEEQTTGAIDEFVARSESVLDEN